MGAVLNRGIIYRALVHIFLWAAVVLYTILGAVIFQTLESATQDVVSDTSARAWAQDFAASLLALNGSEQGRELGEFRGLLGRWDAALAAGSNLSAILQEEQAAVAVGVYPPKWDWTFGAAVLYSFTVVTTIGYGNLTPSSSLGRLVTVLYALVGIPLTMLAIADLGKCLVGGIVAVLRAALRPIAARLCPSLVRPKLPQAARGLGGGDDSESRTRAWTLPVIFAALVLLSAALLPLWEDLGYLDSFYFSFITATTIGFGDIVPHHVDFLLPTLLLITLCIALTSAFIEEAAGLFKRIHYFGAAIKNAGNALVWFGGNKLRVNSLLYTVGKSWGVPESVMADTNLDQLVRDAVRAEIAILQAKKSGAETVRDVRPSIFQFLGPEEVFFMDDKDDD